MLVIKEMSIPKRSISMIRHFLLLSVFLFSCASYQDLQSSIQAEKIEPASLDIVDSLCKLSGQNGSYVYQNTVFIKPGEQLFLDADIVKGSLQNLRVVKNPAKPAILIMVKLSVEKVNSSQQTVLTITNPYTKTLRYHALKKHPTQEIYFPTTTCMISPDVKAGTENWNDEFREIALKDFMLVKPKKELECGY
jgi:hypothetical protein